MAVNPPIINNIVKESDANDRLAKRAHKIRTPFTKPACIKAYAGVGDVTVDSNQR